jgi:hypothetical protein
MRTAVDEVRKQYGIKDVQLTNPTPVQRHGCRMDIRAECRMTTQ